MFFKSFVAAALMVIGVSLALNVQASSQTILAFGDSLTAGYGVQMAESWPSVLERNLKASGQDIHMVNAGVSGDTTAGGRARLGWSLQASDGVPDIVIVALGGNDALRGLSTDQAQKNLDDILFKLKRRDIKVLLAGIMAPPNLGVAYGKALIKVYLDLAAKHDVALYPFILDGVAADPALNQPDGIHPNAEGHAIIARLIEPYVQALLDME